ncbi:MAG: NAD(P)-dependent oxidoreductase [Thermodesulfobacteriota bacterium]|nr:NAD(P)-dependent oxidoreductase [Thermodesulfobacteriota bacterium]
MEKIGLIGVGRMGYPISENLLKKGFPLTIFARKENIKEEMKALGAKIAISPDELAKESDIILLIVTNSHAVNELLFEKDGIGKGASKGTIVVDMTTSDPRVSRKFAKRLLKKGIEYLDAPMSGGVLGAKNAQLLFMVGGKREVYEKCIPLFEAIGKRTIYIGETGSGHLIKLVHNQAALSVFVATCEAVVLGEKLGLSLERMIEVFNLGNARSYASEVRFPKFIIPKNYDMGATFANAYKDISMVRKIGKMAGVKLPITERTYNYFKYAMEKGDGEEDFSKIILKMRDLLNK